MWNCIRHRCVVAIFPAGKSPAPLQLRLLSDTEKAKKMEAKSLAMWSKQIGNLVRKRETLTLISEYIQLQEQYVLSKLQSNERLLRDAINNRNARTNKLS